MFSRMELRPPPDPLVPATVTCSQCGETIYEDEAQAARWGYWSDGVGELYPFCIECATREFAPAAVTNAGYQGSAPREPGASARRTSVRLTATSHT